MKGKGELPQLEETGNPQGMNGRENKSGINGTEHGRRGGGFAGAGGQRHHVERITDRETKTAARAVRSCGKCTRRADSLAPSADQTRTERRNTTGNNGSRTDTNASQVSSCGRTARNRTRQAPGIDQSNTEEPERITAGHEARSRKHQNKEKKQKAG